MGIALHKKKTSHSTLMTEGSIWKHILFFSIPLILGNMLQQLYNTVDSIVVGNFLGSEALAAVGSSSSLIMLLISFSMGAAAGAGVIVSQFIGAQNKKGIHESVHTALAIALILGVVLTAAGLILSPQILRWMGTPEEVMPQSITYLRLYFAGVIFSILYNMASLLFKDASACLFQNRRRVRRSLRGISWRGKGLSIRTMSSPICLMHSHGMRYSSPRPNSPKKR